MTWQELLTLHKDKFDGKKNMWHPEEIALAYQIWNDAYRDKFPQRVDVGCGSCRRAVINGVVNLANNM